MSSNVAKWRVAHPDIEIHDAALETMAPFPSLFANDFIAYLSAKGNADEIVTFVRDLSRELVWAYDLAQNAQHNSDASRLIEAMLDAAKGDGYEFTGRFIRDYAKANNIEVKLVGGEWAPVWMDQLTKTDA